nr:ACP S-malonyltransferase [Actinomyces sp.]
MTTTPPPPAASAPTQVAPAPAGAGLLALSLPAGSAVVCPGQGSQRPGMLAAWWQDADARVPGVLETMSEAAGADLLALGTTASADDLRPTEVAQPLTVATSLACALAVGLARPRVAGASPEPVPVVAGHSLGYLTALALAGVLSPAEAVGLAALRGRAMARCAAEHDGGMTALVGGHREEVLAAIDRAGLAVANVNGSAQVVASGTRGALAALVPPAGARALPLAVAGAFHSPAMSAAQEEVAGAVARLPRRVPSATVIDDADGVARPPQEGSGNLLEAVSTKITRPVRWDLVQETLRGQGTTCLVELAPAGTLTGLARRDLPQARLTRLRSPEDLAERA